MSSKRFTPRGNIVCASFLSMTMFYVFGLGTKTMQAQTDVVTIDAGSPTAVGSYVADTTCSAGAEYDLGQTITIPAASASVAAPEKVYESACQGAVTYTIGGLVSGNTYTVVLHFAELYFPSAGSREFNVAINGTPVAALQNFDIFAAAGGARFTAVVEKVANIIAQNGQITISLTNGAKDQPMINGIEIQGASAPPPSAVAIDAGSPTTVGSYVADSTCNAAAEYDPGQTITIPAAIASVAAPEKVYESACQGPVTYTLGGLVTGNTYTVVLHFAELYFPTAGSREFNVAINGTPIAGLQNFDIFAAARGARFTAVVESIPNITAANGQIVLSLTNGAKDQPMINGIQILAASSPGSCTAVPTAPTNLTAAASSSTSIGLSWTAVTPPANCTITSYNLYASTTSGFTPSAANLIASTTGTTYSDPNLAPSTTYYYVVEAVDAEGVSLASNSASAATLPTASCSAAPPVPAGLTPTATSSSSIALTWSALAAPPNCSVTYNLYGSATSGFTPSASNLLTNTSGTGYTNTGLAASTTFYYVLEAVDAAGFSAFSAQRSTATLGAGSTEIVAIHAGGGAVSNATGGDTSFVADEFFNGGGTAPSNNAVTVTGVTNAAPEAVYDTERNGTFSYTIPGLAPTAQYTVLLHFAETYFTAVGSRVFNVFVNNTSSTPTIANLDIYALVGANNALVESVPTTANAQGQIVIAFTNGSANQPKIDGIEVRGAPSACTILPSTAPTGLTALQSSPSIIGLNWTGITPPPNCAVTYNVYASTTSGFTPSSANLVATGLTNTSYTNTGLLPSTNYFYLVEAVDTAGNSAPSQQASAETNSATSCIAIPSVAPAGLTAAASSSNSIELTWAAIAPPAYCTNITYNLYASSSSGFTPSSSNEIARGLTGTTFFNTGLPASSVFYYIVQAADEDGLSAAVSNQVSNTTSPPPTALTAAASSANEIDLTFPASTGASPILYNVFRSTTSPFTPASTNQVGSSKSNFYNDVVLAPSTKYFYIVQASGPSGTTTLGGPVNATTLPLSPNTPLFWDASNIPATPAGDVITIKFLNRTNGQYPDSQVFWSVTIGGVTTTNSIAAQPILQMPANASGRVYFYLGAVNLNTNNYWDFLEYTLGSTFINMNSTRVDAFGLKYSFRLTCGDGTDIAIGENSATFAEDRASTFQRYLNAVPANFQTLAQLQGPYRIVSPSAGGFDTGGPYQTYYNNWISQIWAANGITIPLAIPNGDGLSQLPDLSAAIYRHVGGNAGTFNPDGTLKLQSLWGNPSNFYQTSPASYYAQFLHANAINGQQYGFPFDDAGGYSGDVSCQSPDTLLVAIGW